MDRSSKYAPSRRRCRSVQGYTLVELLVASSILMMGISAACLMSMAMVTQEEMNHRISRGLNFQENAARLYQLGLSPGEITAVLPPDDSVSLAWTSADTTLTGIGAVTGQTITATLYGTEPSSNAASNTGYWTGGAPPAGSTSRPSRAHSLTIYRTR